MTPSKEAKTFSALRPRESSDRREHERLGLQIPVVVDILIPEETFRPRQLLAESNDVSASGMNLTIEDMTQDLYSKLEGQSRHVRVSFTDGYTSERIRVIGRVVGTYYRKKKPSDVSGPCDLRVVFPPDARRVFRAKS